MYGDCTVVNWHRFRDEDKEWGDWGTWEIKQGVQIMGVLEVARANTDKGIEVEINLDKKA